MVNSHYKLRRPNLFTISLGAIKHNLIEIRKLVGFSTKIIAALKSNAYGFGLEEVTKVVTSEGVDAVALSDLSDASRVRSLNKNIPILLYAGNIVNSETVTAFLQTWQNEFHWTGVVRLWKYLKRLFQQMIT